MKEKITSTPIEECIEEITGELVIFKGLVKSMEFRAVEILYREMKSIRDKEQESSGARRRLVN